MSDTPRTDAEAFNIDGRGVWAYLPNGDYTKASFARELERENAALRNKLAGLEHCSQWQCSCGGTDCEGMKENVELRRLLREAITSLARYRAAVGKEAKP